VGMRIARHVLVLVTGSELVGELSAASPLAVVQRHLNANDQFKRITDLWKNYYKDK